MSTHNDRQRGETISSNETRQETRSSKSSQRNRSTAAKEGSRSIAQFFDFSQKDGVIKSGRGNARVFMLGSEMWSDIEKDVVRIFSTAGLVILDNIGHSYGLSFAKRVKSRSKSPTINALKNLATTSGWGNFSVSADAKGGSWIRVISKDCAFCHGAEGNNPKHECTFLSGVVRGLAEEFYGKEYVVLRNKCFNSAGHSCEVVLQEASTETARGRRGLKWTSSLLRESFP